MPLHGNHTGMVYIPGGPFTMGTDKGNFPNEEPARQEFAQGFWIDANLVTNVEFERVFPRHDRGASSPEDDMPVVDVTWWEALSYCRSLRKRLPTEKEWEKAARGPRHLLFSYSNGFDAAKANVWPAVRHTSRVRSYPANEYGLFDMSGNVCQMTGTVLRLDKFRFCVIKGGSWGTCSKGSRAVARGVHDLVVRSSRVGFRPACSCPAPGYCPGPAPA